jgi:hypothetical protein
VVRRVSFHDDSVPFFPIRVSSYLDFIIFYTGQYVFGYDNCRIAFIVEGKLEKQQVTGGYVGSARFQVPKARFEEEIANLEAEGFDVLRTTRAENSMFQLSRWAEKVAKEVQNGKLQLKYTYNEFVAQLKKIPNEIDFSRLAKDYAKQRNEQAALRKRQDDTLSLVRNEREEKRDNKVDSDNYKGGVKGVQPLVLDRKLKKHLKRPPDSTQPITVHKKVKTQNEKSGVNYEECTTSQLQQKCVEYGMAKTGTKKQLINRLQGPRPPEVYILRRKGGLYVPKTPDTGATALLVAIQILQDQETTGNNRVGFTKDELYTLAETLEITKNPFSGGATQTGPFRK